jgi:hypothetical protein
MTTSNSISVNALFDVRRPHPIYPALAPFYNGKLGI